MGQIVGREGELAFAALADLPAPAVDRGLVELPDVQRVAPEVALLRSAPRGAPPDRRAVGTATRSLLRRCAADGPVLIARTIAASSPLLAPLARFRWAQGDVRPSDPISSF